LLPLRLTVAPTRGFEDRDSRTRGAASHGDSNWIVIEGATRDGATFSFREVRIDGNVLDKAVFEGAKMIGHPFAAPE
jgi:hypothetical protein